MNKAFEKYYRSDDLNVRVNSGMGIGLYYSKKIIEYHQGLIEIKSEKNVGTEIMIKLPVVQHYDSSKNTTG
jgi:signal transduction histidine kinase